MAWIYLDFLALCNNILSQLSLYQFKLYNKNNMLTKINSSVLMLIPIFFFVTFISCKQSKPSSTENANPQPSEEFMIDELSNLGFASAIIDSMETAIEKDIYPNIHSVLILKDNKLVYEQYFAGEDELWGEKLGVIEHHKDSLHDVRSVSKSVVAACIGIAIKREMISSLEQKIFDFFPEYEEYNTGRRSELTIKHLLNMSSGMQWNENVPYDDPENSEIQMTSSADPIAFVLSREIIHQPGEVWGIQWRHNTTSGCHH